MAASALIQVVAFLARPASTYRAIELGLPAAALGAIGAAFAIVPLFLAVPLGRHVNRVGERRLHAAGAALLVCACLVLAVNSVNVMWLLVANAALGAGHLACVVAQQTLVSTVYEDQRLDSAFGYYTFAGSVGQAAGPALIAVLGGTAVVPDTGRIFFVALAVAMILVALTPSLGPDRNLQHRHTSDPLSSRLLLAVPGVKRSLVTSAVVLAAVDLSTVYLPAIGVERGLSSSVIGGLLVARAVFSMLSRLLMGRLAALLGRTRLLRISVLVAGLSFAAMAAPVPVPVLFALTVPLGLGLGLGQPLTASWLSQQVPIVQRGHALAIRLAGNRLGQLVLPAAFGLAATSGAAGALIAVSASLGAVLGLLRSVNLDEPGKANEG